MVQDFDSYLANIQQKLESQQQQKQKQQKLQNSSDNLVIEDRGPNEVRTLRNYTSGTFRSTLKHFIETNSKYKELTQQKTVLEQMAKKYKAAGEIEFFDKCKQELELINTDVDNLKRLFKENKSKAELDEINNKLKSNDELKVYDNELKEIKKQLADKSRKNLYNKLRTIRKQLGIAGSGEKLFDELDGESGDDVIDFDDLISEMNSSTIENKSLKDEYNDILLAIAKYTNSDTSKIKRMSTAEIHALLKNYEYEHVEEIEALEVRKDEVEMKRTLIKNDIYGSNTSIEAMMVNDRKYYDIDGEGVKAKELLAARYQPRVSQIAYKICESKFGDLSLLDEAIGYGLMHLAVYINKWHNLQRNSDKPIMFEPLFSVIGNSIQRDMLTLKGGGVISGSLMADKHSRRNKLAKSLFNGYKLEYPQLSDEDIMAMVEADVKDDDYSLPEISNESKMMDVVGGSDSDDNANIWANINVDDDMYSNAETRMFMLEIYESYAKCIKKIFSLKKKKSKSINGKRVVKEDPLFDIIDIKLYLWHNGLSQIPGKPLTVDKPKYTQTDLAVGLTEYFKSIHQSKTFSQAAIAARLNNLYQKLKDVLQLPENAKLNKKFTEIKQTIDEYPGVFEKIVLEKNSIQEEEEEDYNE